jgi:hypothetical protein
MSDLTDHNHELFDQVRAAVHAYPMTRRIPRQRVFGWKGVSRTSYNDLSLAIGTFRLGHLATTTIAGNRTHESARNVAAEVIKWNPWGGIAPTWSQCSFIQKAAMLTKLEIRHPWLRNFEDQWAAEVIMASHVTPKSKYIRDIHSISAADLAAYRSNPIREHIHVDLNDQRAEALKAAADYTHVDNDSDLDHGSSLPPVIGRRPRINPMEYEPASSVGPPSPEAFEPAVHPIREQAPVSGRTAHATNYLRRRKIATQRFCEGCNSMHPLLFFAAPGNPRVQQSTRLCYNCQLKAQAVTVSTDNTCT